MSEEVVAKKIPLQGIVYDLSNSEYHRCDDAISNSGLNDFAKSPAHFYGRHLDPRRPPPKPRPGQLEGTLAHCALFEPYEFDRRFIVGPDVNKNTKVWKEFVVDAEAQKKEAITQDQKDVALEQAKEAMRLPTVAEGLASGFPEVSVFALDEDYGVRVRARPDFVHPIEKSPHGGGVVIFDGKTYSDASPREFSKQVFRKGYHRQAPFYADVYKAATGLDVLAFVFICLENEHPFKAAAFMLKPEDMERGREEYKALLCRYAKCRETNEWPGYGDDITMIDLPRFK